MVEVGWGLIFKAMHRLRLECSKIWDRGSNYSLHLLYSFLYLTYFYLPLYCLYPLCLWISKWLLSCKQQKLTLANISKKWNLPELTHYRIALRQLTELRPGNWALKQKSIPEHISLSSLSFWVLVFSFDSISSWIFLPTLMPCISDLQFKIINQGNFLSFKSLGPIKPYYSVLFQCKCPIFSLELSFVKCEKIFQRR